MLSLSVVNGGTHWVCLSAVRLGNSGLKVSKIILGCMSYGSPEWQNWVLPEEEAVKQIKFAYVSRLHFSCFFIKLLCSQLGQRDNDV